ncbi:TonB-dependent receptor [Flammeovirga pectinis]|uniref:TonB-dependent receptor n=1 Tax=Flammeovirga pectinis TaxID=2494373 RepID=A0A3Q9FRA1_9BACT|nr:outer membrane beta-barrel family protein [Flammeovirga pectinis]AZQ62703.1 TonB-dependent receptor [Flammeovirga pectinis]
MLRHLLNFSILFLITTSAFAQDENKGQKKSTTSNDRYIIGDNIKIVDGNALDALKLIPAVDVSAEGVVSYRNDQSVQVFLNNRPASQSGEYGPILEQILVGDIEYIDIISNPSARYDADGASGIINIAVKSNNIKNSSANVMIGSAGQDRYDAGIGFQQQDGKFSFNTSYNFKQESRGATMDANLKNFGDNEPLKNTDQTFEGYNGFQKHNFQLGGEYAFNEKNNLSVSTNFVKVDWTRGGDLSTVTTINDGMPDTDFQHNNMDGSKFKGEARVDYIHTTDREGEELAISTAYAAGNVDIDKTLGFYELNNKAATFNNFSFQTDYARNLNRGLRLETGVKTTIRSKSDGLYVENWDDNSESFQPTDSRNNVFNYNEYVAAGYVMVSGTKNKFTYQFGVRAEQTMIRSYLDETPGDVYENNYFKVYPSINLKQDLSDIDNIFFSYSKKVQRPGMRMINPFVDYSNPSYIRQGNPDLDASFMDAFELGYSLDKEKFNFKGSVYYKLNQDPAMWYTHEGEDGVMVNSVENMDKSSSAGIELIADVEVNKWWNVNTNVNIFYAMIDGRNIDPNVYQTSYNWSTTVTSNMKLWKGAQFMMSGTYLSPQKNPQGDVYKRYFINTSISQSIWEGKGSLVLSFDDALDTQRYVMSRSQPTFSEHKTYDWDSRILRVTFRYRLGSNPKKSKNKNGNQQGGSGVVDVF